MNEIYINDPQFGDQQCLSLIKDNITSKGVDITFFYDSDFSSTKTLRTYIEYICDALQLENKWKSRLILITDELNNNAIEYGSQKGERNRMYVSIKRNENEDRIYIEIEDTGKGNSHKNALEMETLRTQKLSEGFKNHHSIRGRGLFMIINNLVDTLSFNDSPSGGLIVKVQKNIPNKINISVIGG